jgi:hypothetical protein
MINMTTKLALTTPLMKSEEVLLDVETVSSVNGVLDTDTDALAEAKLLPHDPVQNDCKAATKAPDDAEVAILDEMVDNSAVVEATFG